MILTAFHDTKIEVNIKILMIVKHYTNDITLGILYHINEINVLDYFDQFNMIKTLNSFFLQNYSNCSIHIVFKFIKIYFILFVL